MAVPQTHYEDNRAPLSPRVVVALLGRFVLYAARETANKIVPYPHETAHYFLPSVQSLAFVHTSTGLVQSTSARPGLQVNTANVESLRGNQV